MAKLLKISALMYMLFSIIVCSTPRCGYIIQSLQAVEMTSVEMSCHDEGEKPDPSQSFFSAHRNCDCELLSFVVTEPLPQVRSIEKIEEELFIVSKSQFNSSIKNITLDIQTPPPRLS